jgi:hypothetical protein
LGYGGSNFTTTAHQVFINVQPFESTGDRDRIVYNLPLGAFTFSAVYEKSTEVDTANTGSQFWYNNPGYDDDYDQFAMVGTYKWATGSANLTGVYQRQRNLYSGLVDAAWGGVPWWEADVERDSFIIAPAVIANFGPFSMHFEFDYMWGTVKYDDFPTNWAGLAARPDEDQQGWGVYLDGWYNYGPGEVGMLFNYVQGTNWDRAGNETYEGLMGYGADHYPFLVGYALASNHDLTDGVLLNDNNGDGFLDGGSQNFWNVGLMADHNLTERLMLHAAVGYFALVNTPDRNAYLAPLQTEELSKDLGWELDLGLNWKIMEGLDFTSMFGYFWGGSAWDYGNAVQNVLGEDTGNAYAWRNMLWMSF